jgi:hypothetical protein
MSLWHLKLRKGHEKDGGKVASRANHAYERMVRNIYSVIGEETAFAKYLFSFWEMEALLM